VLVVALSMVLSVWVTPPAQATRVALTSVPCPLDGTAVKVHSRLSSDTHGGWDSDLASYSSQGQWRSYALATCPTDHLTLQGPDFAELGSDDLEATSKVLTRWKKRFPDPDAIPPWTRFELAADIYRALGRGPEELAQLYLQGSWVARDQVVGVYLGLEGPQPARQLLEAGRHELERDLDPTTRKIVLHNLARVAHRGGFGEERDAWLDTFEAVGELTPREREVLDQFRLVTSTIEPHLQDLAIAELDRFLASNPADDVARIRATYQLADLHRRRGRSAEAAAGFAFVVASSACPEDLREVAAFLGEQLAPE